MSNTVPEGWNILSLGHLTDVRSSNVDKKSNDSDIPVRLCNYTDVYYNNKINSQIDFMQATAKQREVDRFSLCKGDVIITKDSETPNDIAVPAFVSEDISGVVCGYHLTLLKPKKDRCDGEFLSHLFQLPTVQHYFYILANGITRFGLTSEGINSAPLLTPPLPEQQKIAAILSSVDDVIEKTRAQIDKLKDLKWGMMQELLTKGIGPDGKPHTEFKDSPVGQIPAGWNALTLKDITSRIRDGNYGLDYPKASEMLDSGVPFLTSTVIGKNQYIDDSKLKFISKSKHAQLKKAHIKANDVLFTNRGASVGNVAIVPTHLDDANIGPQLTLLRVIPTILLPEFLYFSLQTESFKTQLRQLDSGSAMNFFGIGTTEQFVLAVPSLEEQAAIVKALLYIETRRNLLVGKLKSVERVKQALMQDLLTGKVRVNIDNKEPAVA